MVNSASFPRFVKVVMVVVVVGGREALKLYVMNLREQHPMLLYFTSQETI